MNPAHPPFDLSVCLIARNEETNLPRALRSVAGLAQDVVVCDTGSRDRTAEVAAAYGARVVHDPWRDDFSRARNVAIDNARGAWILMIDADEELQVDCLPALRVALQRPVLAQIVHNHLLYPGELADAPGGDTVLPALRLFRRHASIRYHGRVHETLVDSLIALGATTWPDSGVHLRHHGYLDASERRRKAERNLRLLEQAVAEEPDNLYLGYKLAQTLPTEERPRRKTLLRSLAERALTLPTPELMALPFMPALIARAGDELIGDGDLLHAARICQRGAERLGRSLWFTAGRALLHAGALPAAEAALWRYQQGRDTGDDELSQPDPAASPAVARHLLGQTALLSEHYGPAERLLKEAIAAAAPAAYPAMACDLIRVFMRSGRMHAAVAGLTDLTGSCQPGSETGGYREVMLLSAEVSLYLGDLPGALPLLQAALDPEGRDDRAAALLATLLLRLDPPNPSGARAVLPLLPGTRYDTLAVRLLLERLLGRGQRGRDLPAATTRVLSELEGSLLSRLSDINLGGVRLPQPPA